MEKKCFGSPKPNKHFFSSPPMNGNDSILQNGITQANGTRQNTQPNGTRQNGARQTQHSQQQSPPLVPLQRIE